MPKGDKMKQALKKISSIIQSDYNFNKKHGLSLEPEKVCSNAYRQLIETGLTPKGANLLINQTLKEIK